MKPQLRGRFRRNIATLLELGADVTVLTVNTNKDFFLGLDHPRLHAEFLEARSVYLRFAQWAGRRRGGSDQPGRLRRWAMVPLYLVAWLVLRLRRTGPNESGAHESPYPPAGLEDRGWRASAQRLWRRMPLRVRSGRWAVARWSARRRRSWRRWRHRWALTRTRRRRAEVRSRAARPKASLRYRRRAMWRSVVRRRRLLSRALIKQRVKLSRRLTASVKDLLRPWHRVSRFYAFWRESAGRAAQLRPDLVMSSDLPGLVGAGRVARRLGVPHLHDCHELYLESTSFRRVERLLLTPMEQRWIRRAGGVLTVNQSIAQEYLQRYGRPMKVVRNCAPRLSVSIEAGDLRALSGLPSDAQIVLYQGGFTVGRGLDVCLAAVPLLPPDIYFVLLGFGPLRDALLDQAEALGVADRVKVLDPVTPEELPSLTVSASVGLIPYQPVSRNNYLALPNKVFEYTTVGVPIVVSDLPELRHIALEEGCGQVFDSYQPSSLAAALASVLDPTRYPDFKRAAQRFGSVNVWENERPRLVDEMARLCPRLSVGVQNSPCLLAAVDPPAAQLPAVV